MYEILMDFLFLAREIISLCPMTTYHSVQKYIYS